MFFDEAFLEEHFGKLGLALAGKAQGLDAGGWFDTEIGAEEGPKSISHEVSLFGMSVSAAELPAMSSALGDRQEVAGYLQRRLKSGLRRIAFFVVPSAMAFLALGGVMSSLLFENGRFTHTDSLYVWGIV